MDRKSNLAVNVLVFLPVILAVGSLINDFQFLDLIYLIFAAILFRNYKTIRK